jgi:hypothetical protein
MKQFIVLLVTVVLAANYAHSFAMQYKLSWCHSQDRLPILLVSASPSLRFTLDKMNHFIES